MFCNVWALWNQRNESMKIPFVNRSNSCLLDLMMMKVVPRLTVFMTLSSIIPIRVPIGRLFTAFAMNSVSNF